MHVMIVAFPSLAFAFMLLLISHAIILLLPANSASYFCIYFWHFHPYIL